ncbi:competence protein ComEC, putative [Entamoeba histolytica HM-1:IMSS-B]|uniref:Competence protein ComEC, putative n=6 Tax=Entamoeba histolytica TaxID=5759 RepID=C4LTY7_ENTH1|nr:competence protein ComEC, putative [Entamoeba histolytica HM-1:IMSS]EMD46907.1 competence protein comEC, putative [Entamoeba histolytica KU27]EMH76532.1 competence protein ComEC, putative [Entamoeba histolytica HM-1:IMSS-B]EMS14279.1 competence protein ComEC, putative [Entamoeba histolytica HM-3:IMSS]ENY63639.1 competence protein ComEC, putative [Entamoeba histolytica HM-1:IMSS-A]GAT92049.1 competence protein comec putative [Entamoeba histolytica]|eukprot:XP_656779.1 competence protein ComEC, putative [Entamoeba histolytica HM-1:IMSS]
MYFIIFCFYIHHVFSTSGIDIHIFNVGQADSQLIVFPSGYSILIDAGETAPSSMNCKKIADWVFEILGSYHINVGVVTHLHDDHIGTAFKNGFWYLLEKSGIIFDKFIDRDSGIIKNGLAICDDVEDINWHVIGSYGDTAIKWACYASNTQLKTQIMKIREVAKPCSNQINPPDKDALVQIIVSDGLGVLEDGKPISQDFHNSTRKPSENDYSIALRIKYGDFVYSTAGDLDGYYFRDSNIYHDIETPYKDVVGVVDVYHVNHHGSEHSNNLDYLQALQPTVAVISCGQNNRYSHPAQTSMEHITTYSEKVFLTNDCNPEVTNNFIEQVVIVNDKILIHYPKNGEKFYVSDSTETFKIAFAVKKNKPTPAVCKL